MSMLSALSAMVMKGQLASLLVGLGFFSAGLAILAVAIKSVLPSAPMLILILIGLAIFSLSVWVVVDQLDARKKKRELDMLLAQVQANKK